MNSIKCQSVQPSKNAWLKAVGDIFEQEKAILKSVANILAPDGGTPPSLHQAAQQIGTGVSALEKALKIGIKLGDIILVGKNRYVPSTLVINLKISAEKLASKSADGLFSISDFRDEISMGRNFTIDLLEYFDQVALLYEWVACVACGSPLKTFWERNKTIRKRIAPWWGA